MRTSRETIIERVEGYLRILDYCVPLSDRWVKMESALLNILYFNANGKLTKAEIEKCFQRYHNISGRDEGVSRVA